MTLMRNKFGIYLFFQAVLALLPQVAAQDPRATVVPVPPGRLVDIGGHKLHLLCSGAGNPTVTLESGLGGYSIDWGLVQPVVGKQTRVYSYDRAGYAWSEPGPEPRGLQTSVKELHELLNAAGEKPPYIMVGQSWGGRIVRLYAHAYPREVVGMVLIDTYTEGSANLSPSILNSLDQRAEEERDPTCLLPAPLQATRRWASSKPRQQDISDPDEPEAAMQSTTATTKTPLADKPLIVISAGRLSWEAKDRTGGRSYSAELEDHVKAEAFLATLSRNSRFVVARRSFHQVHLYEPELVADAIRQVILAARSGKQLADLH
jgi:pimeloyl-ACP methyl ester carboxylesterase